MAVYIVNGGLPIGILTTIVLPVLLLLVLLQQLVLLLLVLQQQLVLLLTLHVFFLNFQSRGGVYKDANALDPETSTGRSTDEPIFSIPP